MRTSSLFALIALLGIGACAPKADLDKAQAEVAQLSAKVTQLEKANEEQRQRIAKLEAIASRKPAMPVKVGLRKAFLGSGYVAVFSTTIKQDFPILVTFTSKALGTFKQIRVNLTSSVPTELGRAEGVNVEPEDEVLLENTNYESAHLTLRN